MNELLAAGDRIASALLSIGAVTFSPSKPFTWASGLKSPVYCDNRVTLGHPTVRRLITDGFANCLVDQPLEGVIGTATAGIPHAAWLAERLDLPMGYARSQPKAHGRSKQVEGMNPAGRRVVVVEDLISTGMSSGAVVEILRKTGADVLAVLAIFSYGLPDAEATFNRLNTPLWTLTTFDRLVDRARDMLSEVDVRSLQERHQDPHGWSKLQA